MLRMKKIPVLALAFFLLSACDTLGSQSIAISTAIASRTPSVITSTPIILNPMAITPVAPTNTEIPSPTLTFTAAPPTATPAIAPESVSVDILGCNTGFDVVHGMGEVTNAYATLKNNGADDLPNVCAMLRAIDEGREHPDKKACVANLPAQKQVTFKLTVDTAYRTNTIIQVDVSAAGVLLLRKDKQTCADIDLFGGAPADVGAIKPLQ